MNNLGMNISEKMNTANSLDCKNDRESLLEETMKDIIADPFNKIKGSQHGTQLISVAERFLKNCHLSDIQKFHKILEKLRKAATSGDSKKFKADQREKMWQTFHIVCSSLDFIQEVNAYLCPAILQEHCSTLFIQTFLRKMFEKIVHSKLDSSATHHLDIAAVTQISNVEENIVRYAAGFVPFSLRRQCLRRQSKDKKYDEKIACLNAISVNNEDCEHETFLDYTKHWLAKQNRGGMFLLNNEGYLFFRTVEQHCREYFQKKCKRSCLSNIVSPVLNAVFKDRIAMTHWAQATAGQNPLIQDQVMQMCVKLWINIRCHAFAANLIEQFRYIQTKEASAKKALRKSLKNLKV